MKQFTEIINENTQWEILDKKNVKINWSKDLKDIFVYGKKESSNLVKMIKEKIQNSLKEYYKEYPRKFNAQKYGTVTVKVCVDMNDKDVNKLYELYESIGMIGAIHNLNKTIAVYNIIGNTKNKSQVEDIDKINWEKSRKREPSIGDINLPGNGYNNLPGEIITEYRNKLIDIIDSSDVIIRMYEPTNNCEMCIVPVFKNSDVKKLIKSIEENEELMLYKEKLDNTSKAISDYYSSKKPGEYTGD